MNFVLLHTLNLICLMKGKRNIKYKVAIVTTKNTNSHKKEEKLWKSLRYDMIITSS